MEIRNIGIYLKESGRKIISSLSFTLNLGDKAVIIGEEGNGKSTLLKLIYDENMIENYCEYEGQIIKKGLKLGYLEQEFMVDGETLISEFLNDTDIYSNEYVTELYCSLNILDDNRKVSTLSGGEKVKLRLIKILAGTPDVLLLDEPSNDLDLQTLEWLEGFINRVDIPLIYISHDETLIENTANMIIHLEQTHRKTRPRHTVERTDYRHYAETRIQSLSKQEQIARKQREDYKDKMEHWQQIYSKVEHRQNVISRSDPGGARLLKKKIKTMKSQKKRIENDKDDFLDIPDVEEAINFRFNDDVKIPNGKNILDISLDMLEAGGRLLAENISLVVTGHEHIGIIGENGTGKTTFLKEVKKSLEERKDIVLGYMPQNYYELLNYDETPSEFLAADGKKESLTKAFTFLGSMKYTFEEMNHRISSLSGGQKAKLMILKFIFEGCNVLLLDEPTRNFSPLSNPVIREALQNFGGAIICVTHDRKFISEVCGKVYELSGKGLSLINN